MAMGQKTTQDVEPDPEEKKLDLSVAQVAGSSLATVAAALLASKMGVYGTILGAGVVSVVATAGGPVIQHLFRRTGDQLRDTARPRARQAPPPHGGKAAADGATALRAASPAEESGENAGEEFGAATVHGTRVRGWKRTAVASGAAFAIAIGALGTYEAMAGTSVSSGGGTLFSGGTRTAGQDRPATPPAPRDEPPAGEKGGGKGGEKDGRSPGSGTSPSPSDPPGGRSPGPGPDPSRSGEPEPGPSPSKSAPPPDPAPTPTPPAPTPSPDASSPAARRGDAP
ncbi:hypothetical protein [Streptomyces sp. NBC_01294]|uniref:hypothetical protein n=1 Tax=Streptomyces sp. NBC_01294 TaxID=2903815 RepID=UPI002DDB5805|nr:hypothetical protein [Streptomyces sp. NBC_01294]WRZ56599.1 hypothetical protein OG534_08980 [Streptomyces sp. NBC_01294]